MDHQPGGFHFHSHIGNHGLDHLEGSDGLTELSSFPSIMGRNIQAGLGQTYGHSCHERTGAVQGVHGDAEALAFPAYPHGFRNHHIFQDQLTGIGRTDAHLVFFPAHTETGRPFRYDKGRQPADPAGFPGIGEHQEAVGDAPVGDEYLVPVQDVMVPVFYGFGGYCPCIGAGARFRQSKSSQFARIQQVALVFFLFLIASQQNGVGSQGVGGNGGGDTSTALAQFFIDGRNGNAVQSGAAIFFRNNQIQQAHIPRLLENFRSCMVSPVHFFRVGNDFLVYEIFHHRLQIQLLIG